MEFGREACHGKVRRRSRTGRRSCLACRRRYTSLRRNAGAWTMIPFELAEPRSLSESIALLDRDDPAIRPIAGGTALMLMMKAGFFRPIRLVSLRKIEARYRAIAAERRRHAPHRRDGDARRSRTFARDAAPRAGRRAHDARGGERARAQCRDGRRQSRSCRSASRSAAGVGGARRAHRHCRRAAASARFRSRSCSPAITRRRCVTTSSSPS